MSDDTQNNFSPDEQQLIDKLSDTLRNNREHVIISNAVNRKISSTKFPGLNAPKGLPAWKKLIYWSGSLLITSFVAFFIINNIASDNSDKSSLDSIEQDKKENSQILPSRKDSFNIRDLNSNPIAGHPEKTDINQSNGTGAVVGLKGGNSKSADLSGDTFSFLDEIKFNPSADFKQFKNDLRIALGHTGLEFKETKAKDELISYKTDNLKGISNNKMPVDFFVTVKVDKRFPSTLKLSLRYTNEPGRNSYLRGESIETIFHERIKSRIMGLISWKYKP